MASDDDLGHLGLSGDEGNSDSGNSSGSESDDQLAQLTAGRKRRRKKSAAEQAQAAAARKAEAKRRVGRKQESRYLEMEAEEDDEDGRVHEGDIDPEQYTAAYQRARREQDEADRREEQRKRNLDTTYLEGLKERTHGYAAAEEGAVAAFASQKQQEQLPDVRQDPKLWMLHCKEGAEPTILLSLLNKYIHHNNDKRNPLAIYSATSVTRGVIFVEAFREDVVRAACANIPDLYSFRPGAIKQVPVPQMPSVLDVDTGKQQLRKNTWVRVRVGQYKGDLARVHDVLEHGMRVVLQLVPRVDLQRLRLGKEKGRRGRRGVQAPQRHFDPADIRDADPSAEVTLGGGPQWLRGREAYHWKSNYFLDGFLYKEFPATKVSTAGEQPTMSEMQLFKPLPPRVVEGPDASYQEDVEAATRRWERMVRQGLGTNTDATSGDGSRLPELVMGDRVLMRAGDLKGLSGTVESVNSAAKTFVMRLSEELLGEGGPSALELPLRDAVKSFEDGSRVKVTSGPHAGLTGMVLATELTEAGDSMAQLILDGTSEEVMVNSNDLQHTTDFVQSNITVNGCSLHDVVGVREEGALSTGRFTVGMIVALSTRRFSVLCADGDVRQVDPVFIDRHIRQHHDAATVDCNYNQVGVGDRVRVQRSNGSSVEGQVVFVYSATLFVKSRQVPQHGGLFVARGRDAAKIDAVAGSAAALGAAGVTTGARRGGKRVGPPDQYSGRTVRIRTGRYKGYLGLVRNANGQSVVVELHSGNHHVTVKENELEVVGDKTGAMETDRDRRREMRRRELEARRRGGRGARAGRTASRTAGAAGGTTPGYGGGTTPGYGGGTTPGYSGGTTPAIGGSTPAFGSSTPGYGGAGGGTTPAYGGGGGTTPAYGGGGGTTPAYGGAGGTTPAYGGAGGTTPAYGGGGGTTPAYGGGGGTTPAYGVGGTTPAYGTGGGSTTPAYGGSAPAPRRPKWLSVGVLVRADGVERAVQSVDADSAVLDSGSRVVFAQLEAVRPTAAAQRVYVGASLSPGTIVAFDSESCVVRLDDGRQVSADVSNMARMR